MKRAALFLLLTILALPLTAKVSVIRDFASEESLIGDFEKKLVSRLSPLTEEGETVTFLTWESPMLTLSLFGEEKKVPLSADTLDQAVNSLLCYNPHFLSDSEERLDWIYERSLSSASLLERGALYEALSPSGRPVGLLAADRVSEDVTQLNLIRGSSLVPGLELRKTSPWLFTISAGMVFTPSFRVSADAAVSNLSLLYPLRPELKIKLAKDAVGNTAYLFSLGVGYHFPLSVLFGRDVPVLSDSMLGADCFVTLGHAGTFVYGAGYEISLSYLMSGHFGFIFGLEALKVRNDRFSYFSIDTMELKAGVMIR